MMAWRHKHIRICFYAAEDGAMEGIDEVVRVLQAIGQDTRLRILKVLASGTFCVCELEEILGITQPAISHHLAILKDAKLVEDSREGQWVFYRANLARVDECRRALEALFALPIEEVTGMEGMAERVREIATNPRAPRRCREPGAGSAADLPKHAT